jgi:hypothetical protein
MERIMNIRHLAVAAGLAASAPFVAFAGPPAPVIQAVSTVSPGQSLVCASFYHEGDVVRRQECLSKREWNRIRTDTQRQIVELQLRGLLRH